MILWYILLEKCEVKGVLNYITIIIFKISNVINSLFILI